MWQKNIKHSIFFYFLTKKERKGGLGDRSTMSNGSTKSTKSTMVVDVIIAISYLVSCDRRCGLCALIL